MSEGTGAKAPGERALSQSQSRNSLLKGKHGGCQAGISRHQEQSLGRHCRGSAGRSPGAASPTADSRLCHYGHLLREGWAWRRPLSPPGPRLLGWSHLEVLEMFICIPASTLPLSSAGQSQDTYLLVLYTKIFWKISRRFLKSHFMGSISLPPPFFYTMVTNSCIMLIGPISDMSPEGSLKPHY